MKNRIRMMLTGVALGGVGLCAGPALGSGVRVYTTHGYTAPSGHGACSAYSCGVAGTLSVNGCRTSIRVGSGVDAELVRAFQRAGYQAYCSDGRVIVRFGHRRPSIGWVGQDFSARFSWERDCLVITTFRNQCNTCNACRGQSGHDAGWGGRVKQAPACPPSWGNKSGWGGRWSSRRGGRGCR